MTRAFNPIKTYETRLMSLLEPHIPKDKLTKFFNRTADDNIRVAFRMVRLHAAQITEFQKLIIQGFESCGFKFNMEYIKNIPMIVPSKSPTHFIVFPNLTISRYDNAYLTQCSHLLYQEVLEDHIKSYQEDMKSEHKSKRWATFTRAWGTIKRKEEMATAAVLARCLHINDKLTPAQIRDLGAAIDEQRKPMELTFAKTDADIIRMYSSGHVSCMSTKGSEAKGWQFMWKDKGIHPCSFLQYHPYINGVFAVRGKDVIARTFIYDYPDGKRYWGRVFGSNPKYIEQFQATLKAQGFYPLLEVYKRPATFDIPGVEHAGAYIMPIPYCDNLGSSIHATFDKNTKVFHVTTGNSKLSNIAYQTAVGFIKSTDLIAVNCHNCNGIIRRGEGRQAIDGNSFCGETCANQANYIFAYRSDGDRVYVPKSDEVVYDRRAGNWFTNVGAANARGCFPYLEDLDQEDSDEFSSGDYMIMRNDMIFNVKGTDGVARFLGTCSTTCTKTGHTAFVIPKKMVDHIEIKFQRTVEIEDNHHFLAA